MRSFFSKLMGDPNEKELRSAEPVITEINNLEPEYEGLSDSALRAAFNELRSRYEEGESLDDLLPESFALTREASKRALGQRQFDVQLIGGVVLHEGKIAEMKTGEGKTLTATLPIALNAATGDGVHLVYGERLSRPPRHPDRWARFTTPSGSPSAVCSTKQPTSTTRSSSPRMSRCSTSAR